MWLCKSFVKVTSFSFSLRDKSPKIFIGGKVYKSSPRKPATECTEATFPVINSSTIVLSLPFIASTSSLKVFANLTSLKVFIIQGAPNFAKTSFASPIGLRPMAFLKKIDRGIERPILFMCSRNISLLFWSAEEKDSWLTFEIDRLFKIFEKLGCVVFQTMSTLFTKSLVFIGIPL